MHVVHCGIDPARYGPAPDKAAGQRLLFVGRLAAVKGVPVLLTAFAGLRRAFPGASLTLIGDGPERARLAAEAARLGLTGAVTFAGTRAQDEVAAALAQTDIFVLPSFAEGVPVVLMEAMASRLPVVATAIAGVPELVEHGVAGLLVPPGDALALEQALKRLLGDPGLRQRMGAAGRAAVVAGFDGATEAAKLAALLAAG
jgi:glycosyltransferase involved in cell wall biosynthesis